MKAEIVKSNSEEDIIDTLVLLSQEWEKEKSCFGYCANTKEDFEGNEIFLAYVDNEIIGYLFGRCNELKELITPLKKGSKYFEIDEIYVKEKYRSNGIGKALFEYAEKYYKQSVDYITLSTATKNYKSIFHFYVEEIGMTFWSAKLFKKI